MSPCPLPESFDPASPKCADPYGWPITLVAAIPPLPVTNRRRLTFEDHASLLPKRVFHSYPKRSFFTASKQQVGLRYRRIRWPVEEWNGAAPRDCCRTWRQDPVRTTIPAAGTETTGFSNPGVCWICCGEQRATFASLASRTTRRRVVKSFGLWMSTAYLRFCCKRS
jgi:hypothetical protein